MTDEEFDAWLLEVLDCQSTEKPFADEQVGLDYVKALREERDRLAERSERWRQKARDAEARLRDVLRGGDTWHATVRDVGEWPISDERRGAVIALARGDARTPLVEELAALREQAERLAAAPEDEDEATAILARRDARIRAEARAEALEEAARVAERLRLDLLDAQRVLWAVVRSSGGEVRVKQVHLTIADEHCALTRTEDPRTGDEVLVATRALDDGGEG